MVTHTIGPCDLDWHSGRRALVVACVGRDMIRVWPLPVEQPWWEHTEDETARVRALRSSLDLTRGGQDESAT